MRVMHGGGLHAVSRLVAPRLFGSKYKMKESFNFPTTGRDGTILSTLRWSEACLPSLQDVETLVHEEVLSFDLE